MEYTTRLWLTVGAALVILGLALCALILWRNNWDFSKLSTRHYLTNTHIMNESFTDIAVYTDTANVIFIPSDSGSCQVVCYEMEAARHLVTVENGCLTIRVQDQRKWYDHIGMFSVSPKITLALPQNAYEALVVESSTGNTELPGDFSFERIDISGSTGSIHCLASAAKSLELKTHTGWIQADNLTAGTMDIAVSTGKVTLTDIACDSLRSTGSTGTITLSQVIATGSISIRRSTGHVQFDRCDAASLSVQTSTGNITGTLLSDKVFLAQTDTGRIHVPQTDTGGKCQVRTDTGNIQLAIAP